jgi:hypothetical protein
MWPDTYSEILQHTIRLKPETQKLHLDSVDRSVVLRNVATHLQDLNDVTMQKPQNEFSKMFHNKSYAHGLWMSVRKLYRTFSVFLLRWAMSQISSTLCRRLNSYYVMCNWKASVTQGQYSMRMRGWKSQNEWKTSHCSTCRGGYETTNYYCYVMFVDCLILRPPFLLMTFGRLDILQAHTNW